MQLWTIQPIEVHELLEKEGIVICDEKKSPLMQCDAEVFKKGYRWMAEQMRSRIGISPFGVKYPIWAWHTRDWKHKKPDLRGCGFAEKGIRCVCIELEVPDQEVLLSDFDAWHWVLSDSYLAEAINEEENEKEEAWFEALDAEKQNEVKITSWNRIFNLELVDNKWMTRGAYIQATFWVLKKEYVRKVQYFTAR